MPYGTLSKVLFSTLPLTEESVGNHPHQVSKALMLPFREGLGKDINNLVISRNILQLHSASLNPISDEVVPDLDVLQPNVNHRILRELNATLIIAIDDSRSLRTTKQTHQLLVKPNGLTTSVLKIGIGFGIGRGSTRNRNRNR